MRVIKEGKKEEKMRVVCEDCGAELEIEAQDIRKQDNSDFFKDVLYFVQCPCCQNKVILVKAKIPTSYWNILRDIL